MLKKAESSNINSVASANSAAVIALLWYLFCRFFYLPFPDLTVKIFQSWFPALNLQPLWSDNLLGQLAIGVITFPVATWITVYLFTKLYKLFSGNSK